jgi:hypothetical protein
MKLRATVTHATDNYEAYYGSVEHDPLKLIAADRIPCPAYIEIVDEVERGVFSYMILYYDRDGKFLTDSWCQTLDDAKKRARIEFDISDRDWTVIEK